MQRQNHPCPGGTPEPAPGVLISVFRRAGPPLIFIARALITSAAPAFAVFEGWAFVLTAAGDFVLRDLSVAFNVKISRFLQHRAHASNPAKRGAAEVWMGQPPLVVSIRLAIESAFFNAVRTNFVGSEQPGAGGMFPFAK